MPEFGSRSRAKLEHVHPALVEVLEDAIEVIDFSVICGHRGEDEQNEYFATGRSKKRFPESRHNETPSMAVDIAPWNGGIDWYDHLAFARVFGVIEACAHRRAALLRWGGDWDRDLSSTDQSFVDIGHIELIAWKG